MNKKRIPDTQVYFAEADMTEKELEILKLIDAKLGMEDEGLYVLDRVQKNPVTHYLLVVLNKIYYVIRFSIFLKPDKKFYCKVQVLEETTSIAGATTTFSEEKNLGKN